MATWAQRPRSEWSEAAPAPGHPGPRRSRGAPPQRPRPRDGAGRGPPTTPPLPLGRPSHVGAGRGDHRDGPPPASLEGRWARAHFRMGARYQLFGVRRGRVWVPASSTSQVRPVPASPFPWRLVSPRSELGPGDRSPSPERGSGVRPRTGRPRWPRGLREPRPSPGPAPRPPKRDPLFHPKYGPTASRARC